MGKLGYSEPLAAGLSYTRAEQFQIPKRVRGFYEVVVTTNSTNSLYEHGEFANNTMAAANVTLEIQVEPRPDLRVDQILAPEEVDAGAAMSVQFDVINQGTPTTTPVWFDRVYLSLDNQLSYDDQRVFDGVNSAALGTTEAYRTTTDSFIVPKRFRGEVYVIAVADATSTVDEWPNDGNNVLAQAVYVNPLPLADLVVSEVVAPAQAVEGSTIDVHYTVTNLGSGPSDTDEWTETVWLARDRNRPNAGHGDVLLASFSHEGALDVGAGYDRVVTVTLPEKVASGNYYITPWTDSYTQVLEDTLADNVNPDDPHEIDNNNYKARAIAVIGIPPEPVLPPDLVIRTVLPDAQAYGGDAFTVTWTVENEGQGDTASAWNDRVYLSDLPDPNDPKRIAGCWVMSPNRESYTLGNSAKPRRRSP